MKDLIAWYYEHNGFFMNLILGAFGFVILATWTQGAVERRMKKWKKRS